MAHQRFATMFAMAITALVVSGIDAAFAAHRCTITEFNQFDRLLTAAVKDKACERALNRKSISRKKSCADCAASYRNFQRIDAWIAKHPKCAADLHSSQLDRSGHRWIKAYKEMCY